MNFDNWKPRSHYMGLLMTDGRGKSNLEKFNEAKIKWRTKLDEFTAMTDKQKDLKMGAKALQASDDAKAEMDRLKDLIHIENIGDTCKSKLSEIHTELTQGRKRVIESDYLTKGLMVEEDSITLYSVFTGEFHKKNELQGENDWITGMMDFEWIDMVIDTKSSWDIHTFNNTKRKPILSLYQWQLDCYMWLYNKTHARLVYCLINTPEHLIRAQETKLMYKLFGSESNFSMAPQYMLDAFEDAKKELRKNHIFDDLSLNQKIKVFDVERDESRIERIKKRVEYCRWYLNNIDNESLNTDESETE